MKHAKEDHLHPGGITAGLAAAAKEGYHSFDEEDEDYGEYDDESDSGSKQDSKDEDGSEEKDSNENKGEKKSPSIYDNIEIAEVEDENGNRRNVRLLDSQTMKDLASMLS